MHLIGLTGGIATGKSTVAAELARHGATVIDADALAREVVEPGRPAFGEIAARFGPGVITAAGQLDRAGLGSIVFADADARRDLERITHPRVRDLMQQRIAAALAADADLIVAEVPLLFETQSEALYEGVMLAYAPAREQLQRLMARDGIDEAAARQRLAAQMPIDEKRARATWIIDNAGTIDATRGQVARWWNMFAAGQL
ncbi:MAG: dephospho-CoA kinase [Candidatus Dormibacteraeota bacterium]|nr:dephospho-CoA kinase [Candidatus Dormibacteraeota bacterium]